MNGAGPSTSCKALYRDQWLVAVEKPSGVLSHPNLPRPGKGGRPARAAFEGTYDEAERRFDGPGGAVWLVHRLDQDTSGVLLAALDAATAVRCREAFEQGLVRKDYLALVAGLPAPRGAWKDSLVETRGARQVRVAVRRGGAANAELRYEVVVASLPLGLALLAVRLVTGRTHQIRVQAASRGHPLLGDDVYGDFGLNRWGRKETGLRRLFLHAGGLELPHPVTGRMLAIRSDLPDDLAGVLARLGLDPPTGRGRSPGPRARRRAD